MDITITPGLLNGTLEAIPSKSQAHRILICAAFADSDTTLICADTNQDIEATVGCLNALGAQIVRTNDGYYVSPISKVPEFATLRCFESGSTLRFMLPIVGALGVDATFLMDGRLPQRPLSPLWEGMERNGCSLARTDVDKIQCTGKLCPGQYSISGKVSSQFITGLIFALSLMDGCSQLQIIDSLESKPYVDMTWQALKMFGVTADYETIVGSRPFTSPGSVEIEGDWSNSAFFLTADAIGSNIQMCNLNQDSKQGDKAITYLLSQLKENTSISAKDIPDLIPILSVAAAANNGATFTDIQRLRLKESDRVDAVINMLQSLGVEAFADESCLTVLPGKFCSGFVDSRNDHRIAMSAAIAATIANGPVTIKDAQCVSKSYPGFWTDYRKLGGNYE